MDQSHATVWPRTIVSAKLDRKRSLPGLMVLAGFATSLSAAQLPPSPLPSAVNTMLNAYCVKCHDADMKRGDLDLTRLGREDITRHPDEWEKLVRKLQARQMPPAGK